jgi:hypothetical protein
MGVQGGEHGAGLALFKVCEARVVSCRNETDARAGENGVRRRRAQSSRVARG